MAIPSFAKLIFPNQNSRITNELLVDGNKSSKQKEVTCIGEHVFNIWNCGSSLIPFDPKRSIPCLSSPFWVGTKWVPPGWWNICTTLVLYHLQPQCTHHVVLGEITWFYFPLIRTNPTTSSEEHGYVEVRRVTRFSSTWDWGIQESNPTNQVLPHWGALKNLNRER